MLITCATLLLATSTNYTQPFAASHGWTYTQTACGGGATCTSGDVSGDGNPSPSVMAKITTGAQARTMSGYWSKSYTWEALGVPAGETVSTVDGQWDDIRVNTSTGCSSSATIGMQVFDSANTTECTAAVVEANLNVSGDSAWTNHNPGGTVNVNAGCAASSTTVTLRFNVNPAAAGSSACELRGDNYKLTIASAQPTGGMVRRVVVLH